MRQVRLAPVAVLIGVGAVQALKYALAVSGVVHPQTRPWELAMLVLTALQAGMLLQAARVSGIRMLRVVLAAFAMTLLLAASARGLLLLGNGEYFAAKEAVLNGDVQSAEFAMDRHAEQWAKGRRLTPRIAVLPIGLVQDLRCAGYADVAHQAIADEEYGIAESCITKAIHACEEEQERVDLTAALDAIHKLNSRVDE